MSGRAAVADEHALRTQANRLGILAMIGAMACFVVNDALIKYVSQTMPAAQLIFIRGLVASILVLAVARAMGVTHRVREIARGWVAARAIVDTVATMLYLVSLFHLPIANATAINMASPFFITVLAALLIGEQVGAPRWLAIGVGFLGVLLIIQPQAEGFNVYALVCLFATLLMAVRDLVMQRVHPGVPSILVTLSTTITVMFLAGGLSLIEGWRPFSAFQMGILAVAAGFLAAGYYLIVSSTRRGDLSLVAPFRYTALLFAMIAGFVAWGDTPNALAWYGIALLIGSGIYVLRASRRTSAATATLD